MQWEKIRQTRKLENQTWKQRKLRLGDDLTFRPGETLEQDPWLDELSALGSILKEGGSKMLFLWLQELENKRKRNNNCYSPGYLYSVTRIYHSGKDLQDKRVILLFSSKVVSGIRHSTSTEESHVKYFRFVATRDHQEYGLRLAPWIDRRLGNSGIK